MSPEKDSFQLAGGAVAEDLTVLMALWRGDSPQHLRRALATATVEQELRPASLVLTIDGELPGELEEVVSEVEDGKYGYATVIRSSTHSGLACALDRGIKACHTRYIARADADDINHPERFSHQLPLMRSQGLQLVGAQMREIDENSSPRHTLRGASALRIRPTEHADISAYMRDHSPFHHPTVIMEKDVLLAAGGYREFPFLEDYDLWHRMKVAGARMGNIDEVLVDYRVTQSLFGRRGGMLLYRSDIRLQRDMVASGTTSRMRALKNLLGRAVYRAIPARMRSWVYWAVIEQGIGR